MSHRNIRRQTPVNKKKRLQVTNESCFQRDPKQEQETKKTINKSKKLKPRGHKHTIPLPTAVTKNNSRIFRRIHFLHPKLTKKKHFDHVQRFRWVSFLDHGLHSLRHSNFPILTSKTSKYPNTPATSSNRPFPYKRIK